MLELESPLSISSRLLPAVKVGDCTISIEPTGRTDEGRISVRAFFDRPGRKTYVDESLSTGCGARWDSAGVRLTMESLVVFLSAAVESRNHRQRRGAETIDDDSNESLFPPFIVRFFDEHSSELESLSCELSGVDG